MITFDQGKRIVDTLHEMGVDWDNICDLWDAESCVQQETRGRAPEVIHRIENYARECRAVAILENGQEYLKNAVWFDRDCNGLCTCDGLPAGAKLTIMGAPGSELIELTADDKDQFRWNFAWDGDEISKIEKYLPKDWGSKYAHAYRIWTGGQHE